MKDIRLIEIGEEIHGDNMKEAARVRKRLTESGTYMVNLMASPGAGKTSVILKTLEALGGGMRTMVIEADMDSRVDADRIAAAGYDAVQVRTGGFCHVDAWMIMKTLDALDLAALDLIILENVGNLICPAQFDTGAHLKIMILSVPEGDDKPLKYPLMFREADALLINKTDFLEITDFNMDRLTERVRQLNPRLAVFPLSCRTGDGIDRWTDWMKSRYLEYRNTR